MSDRPMIRSDRVDGRVCECGAGVSGSNRAKRPICEDGLCWTRLPNERSIVQYDHPTRGTVRATVIATDEEHGTALCALSAKVSEEWPMAALTVLQPRVRTMPEGLELRASYSVCCTACGASFGMRPGLAMQTGMNAGHWTCTSCKAFHHVYIDPVENLAVSRPWEDALREDAEPAPDPSAAWEMCEGCGARKPDARATSWSDHAWCDDCNGGRPR